MAVIQAARHKSCFEIWWFFFLSSLLFWNIQHVPSIPSFPDRAHMLHYPERWRLKSFRKLESQAEKMHHICSADSRKYKSRSRWVKKKWVFGAVYTLLPLWFPPAEDPYHLQRWSFSRGARRLMYHSQGEGGCCRLFQRKAIWNCQDTQKPCPLSSQGAVMNERIRDSRVSPASGTKA